MKYIFNVNADEKIISYQFYDKDNINCYDVLKKINVGDVKPKMNLKKN